MWFGESRKLPLVLQAEITECGLASLSMIAGFYGNPLSMSALRNRFAASSRGTTLDQIIEIARRLGFDTRPLRVELEYLGELQVPCILHWNLNHFVVLKKVSNGRVEIHDPARGVVRLSLAEASEQFTGIALELKPSASFVREAPAERVSLRTLTGTVVGLRRALVQVLSIACALELCALVIPFYMQWTLDQVLVTADLSLLNVLALGFLCVVAFQALMTMARGWAISSIGASIITHWQTNIFSHMLRLPLDYFEKRHIGDVISRFGSVQAIQRTLTGSFVESVLDGVTGLLTIVVLSLYSGWLTVFVLGGLAAYAALRWSANRYLQQVNHESLAFSARQQTHLFETTSGIQAVKLANRQAERQSKFSNLTVEYVNRDVRSQRLGFVFASLNQLLLGAQRVVLVWVAARMVVRGSFSAGMLVAFASYAEQFVSRMGSLVDKLAEFSLLRVHLDRISDIASSAPERDPVLCVDPMAAREPSIEFDNVSFRYSDSDPWILRNCSFRIAAHESVAIVGPSGCGKTTLAKLLLGLLQPTDGAICVGGRDIRKYGLDAYRGMLGAVMQDDQIFSGSIGDNISFFDSEANPPKLERAAQSAAVHDTIVAMPMSYETPLGDMGSSLSGGQKQRVILARALYRKPRILVLDEATSHLDVDCERQINSTVKALQMTRVVIAHRPQTIASADRVLRLFEGRMQEVAPVREPARPQACVND